MSILLYVAVGLAAAALIAALIAIARGHRAPAPTAGIDERLVAVQEELRSLSELFLVPRTRGAVGETLLAELLAAWLPRSGYELQYGFQNGARVDAVVRLGAKLVPIDSKFPLEALQRYLAGPKSDRLPADVRKSLAKHISDISERYIRTDEGTMSFALMYVPSERIYTEIFAGHDDELARAALEKSVVPVSPANLFLYLQTVAYGLRGLALPERTERLLAAIEALRGEINALGRSMEVAGGHLRNLSRSFDEATGRVERIARRPDALSGPADE
jgi:DNA recombination protein RmuC